MNGSVEKFAKKFAGLIAGDVLDVGSFNVNGALRDYLPVTVGVDMRDGPGVDRVCNSSDLLTVFGPESFDAVCSADCLEHTEDWRAALLNMWGVLRPNGVLFLTMANPKKGRHGYPSDYWRWPLDRFCCLFGANDILGRFEEGPSMGVCLRKVHPLDLTHEPDKVPEWPRRIQPSKLK